MAKVINYDLKTKEFDLLNQETPLIEYPNKQFERESYYSLNGKWDVRISNIDSLEGEFKEKILVPYCLESKNSLVCKALKKGEFIIYHRTFSLDKDFIKDKTFINFIGVDQEFDLYINGDKYGHYIPLCLPTKIDISKSIKEVNEIYVVVKDDLDLNIPYGKQVRKQKGMWYTSVSGIYYPVYLESVNEGYIESVKIDTSLDSVTFDVVSSDLDIDVKITFLDKIVYQGKLENKKEIKLNDIHLWNVDTPNLYNVEFKNKSDKVKSYFALRKIEMREGFVYLNNKKIFLNGVLDQGYYPEGIYTVSDYNSYLYDIEVLKDLGINCIRKHIKVELDYFYYLCDKVGMLVLQDFVNNGKYSFIRDTALPTVLYGISLNDKRLHKNKIERENFKKHGEGLIKYLHNHPCIIGYTIFNEAWGQFEADKNYEYFKSLEPNLLFDATSGWFKQNKSDFESHHIYFKDINKRIKNITKPVFISEFGGYSYKIDEHSFNLSNTYGYRLLHSQEDYERDLIDLYKNQILSNKHRLVGCIFTQTSDVEDETNGFMTYDRKVIKVSSEEFKELMREISK